MADHGRLSKGLIYSASEWMSCLQAVRSALEKTGVTQTEILDISTSLNFYVYSHQVMALYPFKMNPLHDSRCDDARFCAYYMLHLQRSKCDRQGGACVSAVVACIRSLCTLILGSLR